jgi:hypothetical protein
VKVRSVEFREAVPVNGGMQMRASEPLALSICDAGVIVPQGAEPFAQIKTHVVLVPWANVRWVVAEEGET